MTQLVILEDCWHRIQKYEKELSHVPFQVTDNVRNFLKLVQKAEQAGTLQLIVMDHDLGRRKGGGCLLNYDSNGLSGTEAAQRIVTNVPILVWSANSEGAERMVDILHLRGLQAGRCPAWQHEEVAKILGSFFPRGG
jgi:CheY-like chemotaxis protein